MAATDRPLRVLMTADTVGGVWTYALELARELRRRGVQVALATMGATLSPHQRADLRRAPGVSLFESSWRLEWMQHPWNDVDAAGDWLLELERRFAPDLVHLNQFAFGALPFQAPTLLVAHSCVFSWWRAVRHEAPPAEWDLYWRNVTAGLAGAGLVAAPTAAMLASLTADYGYAREGLVLPNAVDPSFFAPATPKQPVVFAAGRLWDEAKNLGTLRQAAAGLPWPVQVAGSLAHPDGGVVDTAGVEALGELPRGAVAQRLAAAAIYALPARYEPFGLSILEAALSGCALVLGDLASLRETWGDAAIYVPPDDARVLHRALEQLIHDPIHRSQLARAARARALCFGPARMGDATLAAYARLQPRFAPRAPEDLLCA